MAYQKIANSDWVRRLSDATDIPPVPSNSAYQEYLRWVALGNEPADAPSVSDVPETISDRQFYQRLAQLGFISADEALAAVGPGAIPAALLSLVDGLSDGEERFAAKMLLTGATQFSRSHPLVAAFGSAFGWTPQELDEFWTSASAL